jgi:hypothetical protein
MKKSWQEYIESPAGKSLLGLSPTCVENIRIAAREGFCAGYLAGVKRERQEWVEGASDPSFVIERSAPQ